MGFSGRKKKGATATVRPRLDALVLERHTAVGMRLTEYQSASCVPVEQSGRCFAIKAEAIRLEVLTANAAGIELPDV
jgi:hypothetical protein